MNIILLFEATIFEKIKLRKLRFSYVRNTLFVLKSVEATDNHSKATRNDPNCKPISTS